MKTIQNKLFEGRMKGDTFNHLWKYVVSDRNITEALYKIRSNGDKGKGPDNMGIKDIVSKNFIEIRREILKRLYGKIKCVVREVEIPKENGKTRTLGISNYYDRIAQQCILNIIEPIVEVDFSPTSYGFRKNLNAKHCIGSIYKYMPQTGYVYDCDLKGYFDTVELDRVITKLRKNHGIRDRMLLKSIKTVMWQNTVQPTFKKYNGVGLKQGSILGPILANVMLNDLDWLINNMADEPYENGRIKTQRNNYTLRMVQLRKKNKPLDYIFRYSGRRRVVKLIRYADDFVLIAPTMYDMCDGIMAVEDWVKDNNLEINQEKTKVIKIKDSFNLVFLGYKLRFTRANANWRIIISPKDTRMFIREAKDKFNSVLKHGNPNEFLLYMRGKLEYYDICTNLGNVFSHIERNVMSFQNRNNYKNNCRLISKQHKNNTILLRGREIDLWQMRRHSQVSIRTYISEMNQFWIPGVEYLNDWLETMYKLKDVSNLNSGNIIYVRSMVKQYKKEPIIGINYINIYPGDLEIHHIKQRCNGGNDNYNNLILLHKESHKLIHNTDYEMKINAKINEKKLKMYRDSL